MTDRSATTDLLASYLASRGPMIEAGLDAALPRPEAVPPLLHEAMRYSLFAGGKRVRPVLVLAAAEAVGGRPADVLPTACAVELIHTYSLIHDDLPCMDDSATRRNRPTCHVAFGEAIAVLAGDALHALAFALMTRNAATVDAGRVVQAIEEVASAIGTQGMVGGQVLDLLAENRPVLARFGRWPEDRRDGVQLIHRWKTGALIRASVRAGAVLAGASRARLHDLTAYGEHLGVAFQIVDDILDEVGEAGTLGKDARRDAASSKLTFPAAFGVEESRRVAGVHTEAALAALAQWSAEADVLRALARALLVREF
ncbi:MAG: polyprenyl synthetase family protein [Armatimonadota bacterium]|nr:polyprenyl synthetase family protein [Armatimonadota bacterium]